MPVRNRPTRTRDPTRYPKYLKLLVYILGIYECFNIFLVLCIGISQSFKFRFSGMILNFQKYNSDSQIKFWVFFMYLGQIFGKILDIFRIFKYFCVLWVFFWAGPDSARSKTEPNPNIQILIILLDPTYVPTRIRQDSNRTQTDKL